MAFAFSVPSVPLWLMLFSLPRFREDHFQFAAVLVGLEVAVGDALVGQAVDAGVDDPEPVELARTINTAGAGLRAALVLDARVPAAASR